MSTLTIENLREAQRLIESLGPTPLGIDLFPHWMEEDKAFELKLPADMRPPGPQRKVYIVPATQIDSLYRSLRDAGADVRHTPRVIAQHADAAVVTAPGTSP